MRLRHLALAAVLLAGCASSSDAAAVKATTTTADPAAGFCADFADLAASGGGSQEARDAAGWAENIRIITAMAEDAPDEIKPEAEAYVTMAKDRAELAAENGYVGTADLPADVRTAFVTSHDDLQAQVNQLLAYAKQACPDVATTTP